MQLKQIGNASRIVALINPRGQTGTVLVRDSGTGENFNWNVVGREKLFVAGTVSIDPQNYNAEVRVNKASDILKISHIASAIGESTQLQSSSTAVQKPKDEVFEIYSEAIDRETAELIRLF